jgi:hypothetical protein
MREEELDGWVSSRPRLGKQLFLSCEEYVEKLCSSYFANYSKLFGIFFYVFEMGLKRTDMCDAQNTNNMRNVGLRKSIQEAFQTI